MAQGSATIHSGHASASNTAVNGMLFSGLDYWQNNLTYSFPQSTADYSYNGANYPVYSHPSGITIDVYDGAFGFDAATRNVMARAFDVALAMPSMTKSMARIISTRFTYQTDFPRKIGGNSYSVGIASE